MRMTTTLVALLALLLCAGCSSRQSKMQKKLNEMAATPAATTVGDAKTLYQEASKFVAWLEAHPEDSTPDMLAQARTLRNERAKEAGMSVVNGVVGAVEGVANAIGGMLGGDKDGSVDGKSSKSIEVGKTLGSAVDNVLGVNDPRMKKFGCPDKVDITKEGASKLCP